MITSCERLANTIALLAHAEAIQMSIDCKLVKVSEEDTQANKNNIKELKRLVSHQLYALTTSTGIA